MPHDTVPALSALAIAFLFCFSLWWLRRAGKKFPELEPWTMDLRTFYIVFCLVLFVPGAALVLKGVVTWQHMVTGSGLLIVFYLAVPLLLLAPIYRRALEKSVDT